MEGNFSKEQKKLASDLISTNFKIKAYDGKSVLVLYKGNTQINFLTPLKQRRNG